jgi:hypothetical protein
MAKPKDARLIKYIIQEGNIRKDVSAWRIPERPCYCTREAKEVQGTGPRATAKSLYKKTFSMPTATFDSFWKSMESKTWADYKRSIKGRLDESTMDEYLVIRAENGVQQLYAIPKATAPLPVTAFITSMRMLSEEWEH